MNARHAADRFWSGIIRRLDRRHERRDARDLKAAEDNEDSISRWWTEKRERAVENTGRLLPTQDDLDAIAPHDPPKPSGRHHKDHRGTRPDDWQGPTSGGVQRHHMPAAVPLAVLAIERILRAQTALWDDNAKKITKEGR